MSASSISLTCCLLRVVLLPVSRRVPKLVRVPAGAAAETCQWSPAQYDFRASYSPLGLVFYRGFTLALRGSGAGTGEG